MPQSPPPQHHKPLLSGWTIATIVLIIIVIILLVVMKTANAATMSAGAYLGLAFGVAIGGLAAMCVGIKALMVASEPSSEQFTHGLSLIANDFKTWDRKPAE
jgi:Na+/H+ antiporter NhaC